jgi:glycosyltransferase involved in cell wall biosynthesis
VSHRIALFSWESRYSIACGGLAEHVSELASALQRRGHETHVFTRRAPRQSIYDLINGVHYHRCDFELHPDFITQMDRMGNSFNARLVEAERFYGRPFDIVHAHDWLAAKGMIQAKNDLGRAAVLTLHSTEYGRCGNQLVNGDSSRISGIEWEGTYVADRVICVSRALRAEVQRLYGVPSDKVTAIYNGVDVRRFEGQYERSRVRSRWAAGKDDSLVLFVGRLAWQKGPDLLLNAVPAVLHHVPRARFLFVGDGHMRPELERRAGDMRLFDTVRFAGHQGGTDLIDLFRCADVVCVPSRNEPFGIVVLEAWCASQPVVATRNGGPGEFIRHLDTGLITSEEQDSLAWGLGTAITDRALAENLGRNGRQEVEACFTWDTVARATEQVYASVLGQRPAEAIQQPGLMRQGSERAVA